MNTTLGRFLGRAVHFACVLGMTLVVSGCATPPLVSSTTTVPGEGSSVTGLSPGPVDPEETRQAVLAAIDALGPVRVHIEVTSEFPPEVLPDPAEDEAPPEDVPFELADMYAVSVDLLVDRSRHLALESRRFGAGPFVFRFETSVIGRSVWVVQTVSAGEVEGEGQGEPPETFVHETVLRDPSQGVDWPDQLFFSAPPRTLEIATPLSATRRADGSIELVLRVPQDPVRNGMMGMFTLFAGGEARLTVGADYLPRELVAATDVSGGSSADPDDQGGSPEVIDPDGAIIQRAVYTIEPVASVSESDVRLLLPAGVRSDRLVELPLDHPKPDLDWPAYWLGPAFSGRGLIDANQQTGALVGCETVPQAVKLVYGESGDSWYGEPVGEGTVSLIQVPRDSDAAFNWGVASVEEMPPDQRVVAGRVATVRVSDAEDPYSGAHVVVDFPDVSLMVSTFRPDVTAEEILAALREL